MNHSRLFKFSLCLSYPKAIRDKMTYCTQPNSLDTKTSYYYHYAIVFPFTPLSFRWKIHAEHMKATEIIFKSSVDINAITLKPHVIKSV